MVGRALVCAIFCFIAGISYASAQTVPDLAQLQAMAAPHIGFDVSRDGRWLAIERNGELRVVDLQRPHRSLAIGEGVVPTWSPDGSRLAFYSNRSGHRQLWMWQRTTQENIELTHFDGGIDVDPSARVMFGVRQALEFSWNEHSDSIAFVHRVRFSAPDVEGDQHAEERRVGAQSPAIVLNNSTSPAMTTNGLFGPAAGEAMIPETPRGVDYGFRAREPGVALFMQVFTVQVATREVRQLTSTGRTHFNAVWSLSNDAIYVASVEAETIAIDASQGSIEEIDLASGRSTTLVGGPGIKFQPRVSRADGRLAYFETNNPFDRPRILVRVLSPEVSSQAVPLDRFPQDFVWSGDGHLYVTYKDGPTDALAIFESTGSLRSVLSESVTPIQISDLVAMQSDIAWLQSDTELLSSVQRRRPLGRTATLWSESETPQTLRRGRSIVVTWRDILGEAKRGTILLPPDYVPGRRYPVIVDAYPLVGGASWAHPLEGNFAWAARGYVIFRPSPRAPHAWMSSWTDEQSSRVGQGAAGLDVMVGDVDRGLDYLVERGIADPNRICVYGHSNGGGVVTALIGRLNRFRCAIIVAPAMTNWVRVSLSATDDPTPMLLNGRTLSNSLDEYVRLSAVLHLRNVSTPILIAVGDDDSGATLNAIELYNQLRHINAPVTFVRYPGQGHVFSGDALSDFWTREAAFFDEHLRPVR